MQSVTPTESPIAAVRAPAVASEDDDPTRRNRGGRRAALGARARTWLALSGALIPAGLVVFFALQAGGFFPGSTGVAAAALAVLLALRATLAARPFASLNLPIVVTAAALAAFGAWILASASWSQAPGRALIEFDRVLLYGLAFVLCASLPRDERRLAWAVRTLVLAIFAVCLVGWASRVAPDVVALDPGAKPDRLSQPLTYWNTQGLIAALGAVLALHLASSPREPVLARALGAAAVPLLASTLFFTFSRGAMLAAVCGLAAYVVLYRSRGLLLGLASILPPTAIALAVSYGADRLASADPVDAAALAQGHVVARGVALCTVGALLVSLVASRWVHGPLHRFALAPRARRPVRVAVALIVLAVVVAAPLALGAPDYASRQYDRFVTGDETVAADQRTRLLDAGNNGRIDHWRVALEEFETQPVRGTGAGTYEHSWNRGREADFNVRDGHSLYLETLAELGVVGFGLLALALGTLAGAVLWRGPLRPRRRDATFDPSLDAVFAAALLAWAVHAGLDWIWETPAVTVWVFALGGMVLARRVAPQTPPGPGRSVRVAVGLGCLVLAVIPIQVARSQSALDESVDAFRASPQDCLKAIDASLQSLAAVGARPEPWEIISYCDVGEGEPALAVRAARNAVRADPSSWTYRYALALVQGAVGQDPRPAARQALERNPRSQLARRAVEAFGEAPRGRWPQIARGLPLPKN